MSATGSCMGNVGLISEVWVSRYICNSIEGKIKIFMDRYTESHSSD